MTSWPTAPLIRIIHGEISGKPITNKIATRTEKGNFAVANRLCINNYDGDSIDEWEEVTAVPTAALKHLQDVFRGVDMISTLVAALQAVTSHLPADKPSALDRAVIEVKGVKGAVLHLSEFDPEERLALLLGCLATLQAADHKTPALAMVARICVEWVNLLNPGGDALSEVKACVESDLDGISFIVMSSLAGDAAAALGDSMNNSLKKCLLTIAHHALAWMTGLIEEGER